MNAFQMKTRKTDSASEKIELDEWDSRVISWTRIGTPSGNDRALYPRLREAKIVVDELVSGVTDL